MTAAAARPTHCRRCNAGLCPKNVTGWCRPCFAARNARLRVLNPEVRARLVERGHQMVHLMNTPEADAKRRASYASAGRRQSATKLAWCPEPYWPEYRKLMKRGSWGAAKAREFIERKLADDRARNSILCLADAVHWLNRIAPTKRLDDGNYRYGNTVLSPGELWKRAELKGWKPE